MPPWARGSPSHVPAADWEGLLGLLGRARAPRVWVELRAGLLLLFPAPAGGAFPARLPSPAAAGVSLSLSPSRKEGLGLPG